MAVAYGNAILPYVIAICDYHIVFPPGSADIDPVVARLVMLKEVHGFSQAVLDAFLHELHLQRTGIVRDVLQTLTQSSVCLSPSVEQAIVAMGMTSIKSSRTFFKRVGDARDQLVSMAIGYVNPLLP